MTCLPLPDEEESVRVKQNRHYGFLLVGPQPRAARSLSSWAPQHKESVGSGYKVHFSSCKRAEIIEQGS